MRRIKWLLPFLALLCWPSQSNAVPAYVQSCTMNTGTSTNCTFTISAGALIVVQAFSCGVRSSVGFSDSKGTTYNAFAGTTDSGVCAGRTTSNEFYVGAPSSGGSTTFTIGVNGNIAGIAVIVAEFSGATSTQDGSPQHAVCSSGCTSPASTPNLTTSLTGDLLVSGGAIVGATGVMDPVPYGFTVNVTYALPAGAYPQVNMFFATKISGAPGTYQGKFDVNLATANHESFLSFNATAAPNARRHAYVIRHRPTEQRHKKAVMT